MAQASPPEDATIIEVNGQTINPREHYALDAKNTDHIIVSGRDVLSPGEETQLKALGVEFLEDLGSNNILCRYKPKDLSPLRNLDFVRQVDVYRNRLKIPFFLDQLVQAESRDKAMSTVIDVMVHDDVSDVRPVADSIAEKAGLPRDQFELANGKIRLEAPIDKLAVIASDDRVRVLEEVVEVEFSDSQAKEIVFPAHLSPQGISGYRGQGQIIAVADTGFDAGSAVNCHPAFVGRIEKLISVGRERMAGVSDSDRVNDLDGHGTHVCGTIVGLDFKTDRGTVGGIAQDAKLVMQSLLNNKGKLEIPTAIDEQLFSEAYKNNARVYSSSLGDKLVASMSSDNTKQIHSPLPYQNAAERIDKFVRSYPEALICFSAGNNNETVNGRKPDGEPRAAVGSQAVAKNCLTVGASGSTRTVDPPLSRIDKVTKLLPDRVDPESSRGPTADGRIKPDVVAPGFNIYSARSTLLKEHKPSEASANGLPNMWEVRSGTSHSTPLVAGCAAILRQMLQAKGCETPPAALLKALLINGAEKLPEVDVAAQGFGRVNLLTSAEMLEWPLVTAKKGSAVPPQSAMGGTLIGNSLLQTETLTFDILPPSTNVGKDEEPSKTFDLKITMVYNDLVGTKIQNNLNLIVTNPSTGEMRYGKQTTKSGVEIKNNVEQVVWSPYLKETLTVSVVAQNIFDGKEQDFVLAWSIQSPYISPFAGN